MSKGSGSTRAKSPSNEGGNNKSTAKAYKSIDKAKFVDEGGGVYSAETSNGDVMSIVRGQNSYGTTYYEVQAIWSENAKNMITPTDGMGYGGHHIFTTLNAAKDFARKHLKGDYDKNNK